MQDADLHDVLLRTAGLIHQMRRELENLETLLKRPPLAEVPTVHTLRQSVEGLDNSLAELVHLWQSLPDTIREPQGERAAVDPAAILREESEHQRIAAALAKGPGQVLANAVVELDSILPLPQPLPQVEEGLRRLRDELQQSLAHLRWLIWQLEPPPTLKDLGLGPTLEQFAQQFQTHTGIPVRLDGLGHFPPGLPYTMELALFRIVQEALQNVHLHAQATEVALAVAQEPDALELTVQDNGRGFRERLPSSSLGLISMQDRADLLGATLSIRSSPGRGTRVALRIPLNQPGAVEVHGASNKASASTH